MAERRSPAREPLIDALRALALIGVVVVNATSYPLFPEGTPMGVPLPSASSTAVALQASVVLLLQGKAYPLLALLFGYSVVRSLGGRPSSAHSHEALGQRRARMRRLIVLGAIHGAFIYAGDVLTLYGLCGLLLLRWHALPLSKLRWRFGLMLAISLILAASVAAVPLDRVDAGLDPPEPGSSLLTATSMWQVVELNVTTYALMTFVGGWFIAPEVMAAMVLGAMTARLRALTHARWQGLRSQALRALLPLGLVLSVTYTCAAVWAWTQGVQTVFTSSLLSQLAGWTLGGALTLLLVQRWHQGRWRWLQRLVPLGRYTLTLYLANSVLCLILFTRVGLQVPATTVMLLGYALALWLLAWVLATVAMQRGWHGPLERWLSGSRLVR
jgi:uncharacterized protein